MLLNHPKRQSQHNHEPRPYKKRKVEANRQAGQPYVMSAMNLNEKPQAEAGICSSDHLIPVDGTTHSLFQEKKKKRNKIKQKQYKQKTTPNPK